MDAQRRKLIIPAIFVLIALIPWLSFLPAFDSNTTVSANGFSSNLAGHWHGSGLATCERSKANNGLCTIMLKSPYISMSSFWFDANVDKNGNFTWVAGNPLAGSPGYPSVCSVAIFTKPFGGTCVHVAHATGFVKIGATHLPEFWVKHDYADFFGNPPIMHVVNHHGPKAYPEDTTVPLAPGVYDTQKFLTLLGVLAPGQQPPPGVYFHEIISHDS